MKKGIFRDYFIYFVLLIVIILESFDCFYVGKINNYVETISEGVSPNIVFNSYQDETIPTEDEILNGKSSREIFNYYVEKQKYIMHAGGSIENHKYTNSYDAIDINYQKGNRIFEVDVNYTSDHHLVLIHGWNYYDYKNKLGVPYNSKNPTMSYNEFKDTLLHGKYQTMGIEDLIRFMRTHPYSYFILNIKSGSRKVVSEDALKKIVNEANHDRDILNRFVIWGYNTNIINIAKRIYDFDLITLSYNNPLYADDELNSYEKIINYCKRNNISSLISSNNSFDSKFAKLAKENGLYTFVFTVDNEDDANNYLKNDATMVLSNTLINMDENI